MSIHLSSGEKTRLLSFIGYGNLAAPVWFIGMEERGHGEERLVRRLKFKRVEDLARAHCILGISKHHYPPFVLQRTWRTMCEIMLRLADISPTMENLKTYQASYLGRLGSATFLTELLPLPAPGHHKWEYGSLFGDRVKYEEEVRPKRMEMLCRLISKHKPSLVICSGRTDWKYYEKLFPEAQWEESAPFRIGRARGMRVFLTPHFVPYQMGRARIAKLCQLITGLLRSKHVS